MAGSEATIQLAESGWRIAATILQLLATGAACAAAYWAYRSVMRQEKSHQLEVQRFSAKIALDFYTRYHSRDMVNTRAGAALALLRRQYVTRSTEDVLSFFEHVGMLVKSNMIAQHTAWEHWGFSAVSYWQAFSARKHAGGSRWLENARYLDPEILTNYEYLVNLLQKANKQRQRVICEGREDWVRSFLVNEARHALAALSSKPKEQSDLGTCPVCDWQWVRWFLTREAQGFACPSCAKGGPGEEIWLADDVIGGIQPEEKYFPDRRLYPDLLRQGIGSHSEKPIALEHAEQILRGRHRT